MTPRDTDHGTGATTQRAVIGFEKIVWVALCLLALAFGAAIFWDLVRDWFRLAQL
jgi:hypothetical protein